jgi:hypothetical protein
LQQFVDSVCYNYIQKPRVRSTFVLPAFTEHTKQNNKVAELRFKTSYWSPMDIAQTYIMAGENDKAIKWLQKCFELHDPNLPYLLLPIFDNLREDPRFQEIARKMNLPYK